MIFFGKYTSDLQKNSFVRLSYYFVRFVQKHASMCFERFRALKTAFVQKKVRGYLPIVHSIIFFIRSFRTKAQKKIPVF